MKHGDLSNEIANAIGMRFERVIKTEEGKLNRSAKAFLQGLRNIDCNIHIITTGDRRKAMGFLVKWAVPYQQVHQADSDFEVADLVREHDMITYYDIDKWVLQNVNSRGHGKVDAKQWTSVLVF